MHRATAAWWTVEKVLYFGYQSGFAKLASSPTSLKSNDAEQLWWWYFQNIDFSKLGFYEMNSKDNKLCPKTQLQYNLKLEGATSF